MSTGGLLVAYGGTRFLFCWVACTRGSRFRRLTIARLCTTFTKMAARGSVRPFLHRRVGWAAGQLLVFAFLFLSASVATGQELYFHTGVVQNPQTGENANGWALSYMQGVGGHAMVSITYLNEGDLPRHHRDGYTPQFWLRTDKFYDRFSLAAGIGPYVCFDTDSVRRTSFDAHGWGGVFSLVATWYTKSRFLSKSAATGPRRPTASTRFP